MEMSGEFQIPAPRQTVWEALNDPEILRQSVPGCESIEKLSDTEMTGAVTAKVGPVKATFKGTVTLSDVDAPNSYVLTGQGKGGAAGFAKGVAHVNLSDADGGTLLRYEVDAKVGGKLAQLGQRLIDGTAKKLSTEFFGNFSEILGGEAVAEPEVIEDKRDKDKPDKDQPVRDEPGAIAPAVWIAGVIGAVVMLLLIFAT